MREQREIWSISGGWRRLTKVTGSWAPVCTLLQKPSPQLSQWRLGETPLKEWTRQTPYKPPRVLLQPLLFRRPPKLQLTLAKSYRLLLATFSLPAWRRDKRLRIGVENQIQGSPGLLRVTKILNWRHGTMSMSSDQTLSTASGVLQYNRNLQQKDTGSISEAAPGEVGKQGWRKHRKRSTSAYGNHQH